MVSLRGTRSLVYLIDMSWLLRSVRLAFRYVGRMISACLKIAKLKVSYRTDCSDISQIIYWLSCEKILAAANELK